MTQVREIDGGVTTYRFNPNLLLTETDYPDGATETQRMNDQNLVIAQTDALNKTTRLGYDGHGNLTSIQRPEDPSPLQVTYDLSFDKPTEVDPLVGAPTRTVLNPATGDVTHVERDNGTARLALDLTYDAFGNPLSVNNGLATYADLRDADGLLTQVFDARNPETCSYDHRGRVIKRQWKSGRKVSIAYDDFDRVTRVDDSAGPSVIHEWDAVGRLLSRTVTDGTTSQVTRYDWDERDRLVSITDALGHKSTRGYDQVLPDHTVRVIDRPTRVKDALGNATELEYDSRLRLSETIDAKLGVTRYGYNLRGDLVSVMDADHNVTTYAWDGNRRKVSKTEPTVAGSGGHPAVSINAQTLYSYDLAGKRVRQDQVPARANGAHQVVEWRYDPLDRMVEKRLLREKGGRIVSVQDDSNYSYAPALDTLRLTEADNEVARLGFESEAVPPFANSAYSVHASAKGNPLELIEGRFALERDITGQIAGVISPRGDGPREDGDRDDDEQRTLELFHSTFDPAGRLASVHSTFSEHRPFTASVFYDGFGRKRSVVSSTGLLGSFSYDPVNRLTSVYWNGDDGSSEGPRQNFAEKIDYDSAGEITEIAREIGDLAFGYDALHELTSTRFKPAPHSPQRWTQGELSILNRTWQYDATGNRLSDSLEGPGSFVANVILSNAKDNFVSDPDGFGNLTQIIDKRTGTAELLSYRVDGKLQSFAKQVDEDFDGDHDSRDPVVQKVKYAYDALGRRVAKMFGKRRGRSERYLVQSFSYLDTQDRILLARSGERGLHLYLDGHGIDEHLAELSRYRAKAYVTDHLGSVLNTKAADNARVFGAFGERLERGRLAMRMESEPVLYGFAGRQLDPESGLYYNRARMYAPGIGRFTSRDPIGFGAGGKNAYVYAIDNPLAFIDPAGLCEAAYGSGGYYGYKSRDAAAYAVISSLNPISIANNVEIGGNIYYDPVQDVYFVADVAIGNATSVDRMLAIESNGNIAVAAFHTHGDWTWLYSDNSFSSQDIDNSIRTGLPEYLGTPSGVDRVYDPSTGSDSEFTPSDSSSSYDTSYSDESYDSGDI